MPCAWCHACGSLTAPYINCSQFACIKRELVRCGTRVSGLPLEVVNDIIQTEALTYLIGLIHVSLFCQNCIDAFKTYSIQHNLNNF